MLWQIWKSHKMKGGIAQIVKQLGLASQRQYFNNFLIPTFAIQGRNFSCHKPKLSVYDTR